MLPIGKFNNKFLGGEGRENLKQQKLENKGCRRLGPEIFDSNNTKFLPSRLPSKALCWQARWVAYRFGQRIPTETLVVKFSILTFNFVVSKALGLGTPQAEGPIESIYPENLPTEKTHRDLLV